MTSPWRETYTYESDPTPPVGFGPFKTTLTITPHRSTWGVTRWRHEVISTDGHGGGTVVGYHRSYIAAVYHGVRDWLTERRRWNRAFRTYHERHSHG